MKGASAWMSSGVTNVRPESAARAFAARGATVVLNGFGPARDIAEARSAIEEEFGVETAYSDADMSDPEAIGRMIETAAYRHGRIDILVNNAGIQHVAPVTEFPPDRWDRILAINLSSAFHTVRLALPVMRRSGFGRIVNVASAHGLVASPFKSAYVAAKHGIVGFTKTVALEVAEEPITCNAICPGYVLTPLVEQQIDDQAKVHGISREAVVRDVLAIEGARPIISHTGIRSACDTPRNLPDDLVRQIAAKGGIIGIGFWADVTCDGTPAGIARSIRAAIDLVGEDAVGLGSDWDGSVGVPFDAAGLPALTQALIDQGLTEDQIAKVMGGNTIRYLRETLPR